MGQETGGNSGDVRKSALWGSGNRGGEHRSNALWGKGGRGFVTTGLVVALAVPLAAGAGSGPGKKGGHTPGATFISAELQDMQRTHPNEMVNVIVQADATVSDKDVKKAVHELTKLGRRFEIIDGFDTEAAEPGRAVVHRRMERHPHIASQQCLEDRVHPAVPGPHARPRGQFVDDQHAPAAAPCVGGGR